MLSREDLTNACRKYFHKNQHIEEITRPSKMDASIVSQLFMTWRHNAGDKAGAW